MSMGSSLLRGIAVGLVGFLLLVIGVGVPAHAAGCPDPWAKYELCGNEQWRMFKNRWRYVTPEPGYTNVAIVAVEGDENTVIAHRSKLTLRVTGGTMEGGPYRVSGEWIKGDDNRLFLNKSSLRVVVKGDGATATGVNAKGSDNLVFTNRFSNIRVFAVGDGIEAFGMRARGGGNVLVNDNRSRINVKAFGHGAEATGMAAIGHGNELENEDKSLISVAAIGRGAEAAGMLVRGHGNEAENDDRSMIWVLADGRGAEAAGIVGVGHGNELANDERSKIAVTATGRGAEAAGIKAVGFGNELENEERSSIGVLALGKGAEGTGLLAKGNWNELTNEGGSRIAVFAKGRDSEATGMLAVGKGNELVNAGLSSISAFAFGWGADATGMAAVGKGNELVNAGLSSINAFAFGWGAEATGMAAAGKGNELVNAGLSSINVTAFGSGAEATGMAAAGEGNSLVNAGEAVIAVSASGKRARAVGMAVSGSDSELVNMQGASIEAGASGKGASARGMLATGYGHWLVNDSDSSVAGETEGDGSEAFGIALHGTGHRADNFGTITAIANGTGARAVGIEVLVGAAGDDPDNMVVRFTNAGSGVVRAAADGEDARAVGVYIDALPGVENPARVEIVNEGVIIGGIRVGPGGPSTSILLDQESKTDGDVLLDGGNNQVTIWAGAIIDGVVDGGYNSTSETQTSRLHLTGSIEKSTLLEARNFRTADVVGGSWVFGKRTELWLERMDVSHSRIMATSDVQRFYVEQLTLGDEAVLGGAGIIAGNVTNNTGVVSPGMSPGTLTIVGNYTHNAGAVLASEVYDDGQHDRLKVVKDETDPDNTGNVTLNGGKLVVLVHGSNREHRGTVSYVLVSAETALHVNEAPDVQVVVENPVYLRHEINYSANEVTFVLTGMSYEDIGSTNNEQQVGKGLDNMPEDHVLVKALYSAATEEQAQLWLDQLSGEVYTTYPAVGISTADGFRRAVETGIAQPQEASERYAWVSYYSDGHLVYGDEEHSAYHYYTRGAAAGVDVVQGKNGRLGVAAGITLAGLQMGSHPDKVFAEGHQVGVYGEYHADALRVTAVAAYGKARYDTERHISVGNGEDLFERTAKSRYNGQQVLVAVRGEGNRSVEGPRVIDPVVGVSWMTLSRDAVVEDGADEANLALERYESSVLRGELGVRVRFAPVTTEEGWQLERSLWASYVHEFTSPERKMLARFAGTGGSTAEDSDAMVIEGRSRSAGAVQVGLRLAGMQTEGSMSWTLQYEGEFRRGALNHFVHGSVQFRF